MNIKKVLSVCSDLYNGEEYEASLAAFDTALASYPSPNEQKLLTPYLPIKLRCLYELNRYDELMVCLDKAYSDYQDDDWLLISFNEILLHFELAHFLLKLAPTSRFITAQQYRIAVELAQFDKADAALTAYLALPPSRFESYIYFTDEQGTKHCFYESDIQDCSITSMPNNNIYINVKIMTHELTLKADIPGDGNDGICEDGSITFTTEGKNYIGTINRCNVNSRVMWSPHYIQAETSIGRLTIVNTQQAGK
ncbi:tetratricopeptide repeat protein [Paraglaciecola sp. 2405UD69-4]|uniref:tetratricopeptide repeat protein n=1 Tax=Paraglaciecola sp. 2405UD69-4 TaxID=3391836 RepID=UPI0039C95ECC